MASRGFCGYDILPDYGAFDIFKQASAIPRALEDSQRHLAEHCLTIVASRT
jgi:NADPH dehydrogenase (quinone)